MDVTSPRCPRYLRTCTLGTVPFLGTCLRPQGHPVSAVWTPPSSSPPPKSDRHISVVPSSCMAPGCCREHVLSLTGEHQLRRTLPGRDRRNSRCPAVMEGERATRDGKLHPRPLLRRTPPRSPTTHRSNLRHPSCPSIHPSIHLHHAHKPPSSPSPPSGLPSCFLCTKDNY